MMIEELEGRYHDAEVETPKMDNMDEFIAAVQKFVREYDGEDSR